MSKTLIIGGVAGGATAAARLRRLDGEMEIVVLERGPYISYANCGLPYHIGQVIERRGALLLQTPEAMKSKFNVDVRVESEALSIDKEAKTVRVRGADGVEYTESYDDLVIATGSRPFVPPIKGADQEGIYTLWTVPDTDAIKARIEAGGVRSAAVIGGGFIGLEVAENLRELGLDVVLIEAQNQVMANFDFEMAQILHTEIAASGVDLRLSDGVKEIRAVGAEVGEAEEGCGAGGEESHAAGCGDSRGDSAGEKKPAHGKWEVILERTASVAADLVILSIGVRPNNELAKAAGLALGERGGVIVDPYMRTSADGIWAAGDVLEVEHYVTKKPAMIPLAGPANKQGRIIANNIVASRRGGELERYEGSMGTGIAKVFGLTAASVGINERTALAQGMKLHEDFHIVQIRQRSHAAYYPGSKELDMRVLFDRGGAILGAQIIGADGVDKRIDVIATVMALGGDIRSLKRLELAYAPPYSSAKDPINMVGFVAENLLSGLVAIRMPLEVRKLNESGQILVLDVTENEERAQWEMEGSVHIPHGEVRNRLAELPRDREICVYCAVGVRAYNVARILRQNGFEKVTICAGGRGYYRLATYGVEAKKTEAQQVANP